jgi:hypothetical protein
MDINKKTETTKDYMNVCSKKRREEFINVIPCYGAPNARVWITVI